MLNLYKLFIRIADNYASQFKLTLLYTVLSASMQALALLTLLPVLSALYQQQPFSVLLPWLCVLGLLVILQIIFKLNESRFTYQCWHKLIEEKRLALGQVMYSMPLLNLKKYPSGDLVEIIGNNVMALVSALSQIGTLFVHLLTIPLILIICCVFISWPLGVLLLLACVIMYILFKIAQSHQKSGFVHITDADSQSAVRIIEYIQGLTVFKAIGHTGKKAFRLQQAFSRQRDIQGRMHDSVKKYIFATQAVLQVTLVIILLAGVLLVHYQVISIATLAVIMLLVVYISEPLGLLAAINGLFENARAAQQKIDEIMRQAVAEDDTVPQPVLSHFTVEFDKVQFTYQQQPVLRDLTLTLPQNTITGVVGPSGSGKTTLTQLIAGFITPDSGAIRIGDVDISSMRSKNLLSYISVVYQDVWLFNDSIKNNLLTGNSKATDEEIFQAARAANIHDFILSLPQQYDTVTGDIGAFLSGGEKQRLSIARAILKNAPLVILDEPTSSLDSESEYQVQQALDALAKNKTVIVVAHRLSTVKGADNIVVLDNGVIVQQGTHDNLMTDTGNLYHRLWQAQHAGD